MTRDEWLRVVLPGWRPLLAELDAKLKERWPAYTIDRVVERNGTLRFDAQPGLDVPVFDETTTSGALARDAWYAERVEPFYAIINDYEDRSGQVCELCGHPGTLGSSGHVWATRCGDCAPAGWDVNNYECLHIEIVDGSCTECGAGRLARLEHDGRLLVRTHVFGSCLGEHCTLHNRSDHVMRSFPQNWREDRMLMERVCSHGVGHPDPDDIALVGPDGAVAGVHGCDGCCGGGVA